MNESAAINQQPLESGETRGWSVADVERLMAAMKREEVNLLDWTDDSGLSLRLDRSAAPQAVRQDFTRPAVPSASVAETNPGEGGLPLMPAAQAPSGRAAASSTALLQAAALNNAAAPAEPAEPAAVPGSWVCAPVVGVFFAGGSPEAKPYVKVGDPVKTGDVLCIIEAMKLMNEVNSDVSGTVAEIAVENGQKVEYGQKLMRIISSAGGQ
ncbi:acetyl-CoA carboxylase biotin carboxyl carrier protein [Oscillospiraceae bacterium HV4-5-C5C]|nr:acetyl-CoA carboxylase biotin carboxyl carrier protein [Oscillospiraceae bacterium HV4-5-C5C]